MQMETPEADSSVAAPVDAVSIPWYQSFFKAPNLALAMGALVLVFSGVLGYLVIQNKRALDERYCVASERTRTTSRRPKFGK